MDKLDMNEQIKEATNNNNRNNRVDNIVKEMSQKEIYINGIGNAGTITFSMLNKLNLSTVGFFDKKYEYVSEYLGKKVFRIENDLPKDNILLIIAFICSNEELEKTKLYMKELGYKNILYYHEVYNMVTKLDYDNIEEVIKDIEQYMSDERSKIIFKGYIDAVLKLDLDLFPAPDANEQYFPKDIVFKKGYKRFVDCGAFTGDTAKALNRNEGEVEKIVMFEPDLNNFEKLSETLKNNHVAIDEILYPCGVWSKTEILSFKAGFDASSSLAIDGEIHVQCVALDDVLRTFRPTFIKMDIEGAEYEALLGAKTTIETYKPDLAISVYHKLDDIISIPLLLKKINPNYRFYLRTYAYFGMETILYAVDDSNENGIEVNHGKAID